MLVRLGIGRNAGNIVDMFAADAIKAQANGVLSILSPEEVSEHYRLRAEVENTQAELDRATSPTPMAAVRGRTAHIRRFR